MNRGDEKKNTKYKEGDNICEDRWPGFPLKDNPLYEHVRNIVDNGLNMLRTMNTFTPHTQPHNQHKYRTNKQTNQAIVLGVKHTVPYQ